MASRVTDMVDTIAEEFTGDSIALIAVEANLEIPPVFQMRKSKKGVRRSAEARNEVITPSGEMLKQYWRFAVPEPYELPGPLDQDVWVAVQALVDRRGGMPLDGKVSFEIAELVEIMNKSKSGQLYEAIKHSLLLLSSMHIHAENAFYSQDTEELETRTFRLWDVKLSTSRNKKRATSSERNVLEFHEVLVRSFRANYLKGLDPEFYYSLDHTLSKRLYRLIDRKRHENLSWSSELERMKQMVPLAPSYKHNSKIRQVLEPAHEELMERGFLKEVTFGASGGAVRYRVCHDFARRRSLDKPRTSPEEERAVRTLIDKGVWANVAPDLVLRKGPEECLRYVRALPHQSGIKDPGAWLKWAIETGYPLPPEAPGAQLPLLEEQPDGAGSEAGAGAEASAPILPSAEPDPASSSLWDEVLDDLRGTIDSPAWQAWFYGVVPVALQGGTLLLEVPNSFAREYINDRFKEQIVAALKARLGPGIDLQLCLPGERRPHAPRS